MTHKNKRKITKNTLQNKAFNAQKNNQTTKSFSCHWHYQNIKSSTKHALEFSNHHNTNQPKPQTKENQPHQAANKNNTPPRSQMQSIGVSRSFLRINTEIHHCFSLHIVPPQPQTAQAHALLLKYAVHGVGYPPLTQYWQHRVIAQLGSAPRSGRGSRGFKSR